MTLCVNHVTLPTVKGKYPKKTVRLISPECVFQCFHDNHEQKMASGTFS